MKIASLVPAETELLCDLGLENHIVAVTTQCLHPYYIRQKTACITAENKVNQLIQIQPDIILCNSELHTKEEVTIFSQICEVHYSNIKNIDDLLELISNFGILFNCRTASMNLQNKLKFKFKDFMKFIMTKEWKKVAYFVNQNPWEAIGNNTFTNNLLRLNNFQNIYSNHQGVIEVKIKRIRLEGDPDYVFLSSKYKFTDQHVFELGRYTHHAKTVFIEHQMFSWGGSRLIRAFDYFKKLHIRLGEH